MSFPVPAGHADKALHLVRGCIRSARQSNAVSTDVATGDRASSMTGRVPRRRPVVETPGSFQQHARSVTESGCQVKEKSGCGAPPGGKYQSRAGGGVPANNARI